MIAPLPKTSGVGWIVTQRAIDAVPLKGSTVDGVASARIALRDDAPAGAKPVSPP